MARKLVAVLLLVLGSISLVYGLLFHKVTVEATKQREVSVAVSTLPGAEEPAAESGGAAQPAAPEKVREGDGGTVSDDVDPFKSPSGNESSAANSENPFESAPDAPIGLGIRYENRTEDYTELREELESVIVREVTVGGMTRLADGNLQRTYSGKPPSLCPT
jgi:hypothetical protein